MQELVRVSLDAMGGDFAPQVTVQGAVEAVQQKDNVKVFLVGLPDAIEAELSKYTYDKDRIEVVAASEVIEMAEPPVMAIRRKKDSSIVVGLNLVKNGQADAFVSAGSTGAVLVGGQLVVGRIKGVERSPLATLFPTEKGVSLLVDCGANVDVRSSHLVQFAKMGSVYMEHFVGVSNPKVAIVNNGAEEEKGNALVKETFPLLKECGDINFTGSIEARDIPAGAADVIVCDGFVGNCLLYTSCWCWRYWWGCWQIRWAVPVGRAARLRIRKMAVIFAILFPMKAGTPFPMRSSLRWIAMRTAMCC